VRSHVLRARWVRPRASLLPLRCVDAVSGSAVQSVQFHPHGTVVATGGEDGSLKLWDIRVHRLLQHYDAHAGTGPRRSLAPSPVPAAAHPPLFAGPVSSIAFHPSGGFVLSSSMDGLLKARHTAPRPRRQAAALHRARWALGLGHPGGAPALHASRPQERRSRRGFFSARYCAVASLSRAQAPSSWQAASSPPPATTAW
jgi:hypothetical protein